MEKWNHQEAKPTAHRPSGPQTPAPRLTPKESASALGRRLRATWAAEPARSASALMIGMR